MSHHIDQIIYLIDWGNKQYIYQNYDFKTVQKKMPINLMKFLTKWKKILRFMTHHLLLEHKKALIDLNSFKQIYFLFHS